MIPLAGPRFGCRIATVCAVAMVGIALLLAGCTNSAPTAAPTSPGQTVLPTYTGEIISTPPEIYDIITTLPSAPNGAVGYSPYTDGVAVIAYLNDGLDDIDVFEDATTDTPSQTIKRTTTDEIVFLAVGTTPNRLYVHLPVRPNGSLGWIDKTQVELRSNYHSIEIQLSTFTLKAFEKGKEILSTKIGIGEDEVPTPAGFYFTIYTAIPPADQPVYGKYLIGLSGFSEVLDSLNGKGIGRLGIHGTNRPDLLGTKASKGCIRLDNKDIDFLAKRLPLGTPVKVIA